MWVYAQKYLYLKGDSSYTIKNDAKLIPWYSSFIWWLDIKNLMPIFMNINKNFRNERKNLRKSKELDAGVLVYQNLKTHHPD